MNSFKSYFIKKTVISALITCAIAAAVGYLLFGILIKAGVLASTAVSYPFILLVHTAYAGGMAAAVLSAQKSAASAGCTDVPDDPKKFYIIVSAILLAVNIVLALVGYNINHTFVMNMLGSHVMDITSDYAAKFITLSNQELLAKVVEDIGKNLTIATIIAKVIQAGVLFGIFPVAVKKHGELFAK